MKTGTLIRCSECGAPGTASCDCGKPYVTATAVACRAVAANPQKSNRALAEEVGVSYQTIREARKSPDRNLSTERRIGRDGKSYPAKRKRARPVEQEPEEPGIEDEIEGPENHVTAYMIRVDQARRFSFYSGPLRPTKEMVAAARAVAATWSKLAQKLEEAL